MKYRRALVLADLHADPAPALSALGRVAPALAHVLIVARVRQLGGWWSSEPAREPDPRELAALEAWRSAAAALAPSVELRQAPELATDALVELALTDDIDLLVAGARALETAPLVMRVAGRLAIAALWPAGPARTTPVAHLFCVATGQRARAAMATFLREHGEPSLTASVVGASPTDDLAATLQVAGILAHVTALPPRTPSLRAMTDAEACGGPIDLVVLARVPTLLLLGHAWPAPVLLVPAAAPSGPRARAFDITDVVALPGAVRARVDEVTAVGTLVPAADLVLALVSDGRVVATAMTTSSGELELPASVEATWLGAVRVIDDSPPDALAAVDQRFAVLRPGARPLVLFDAELPDARLRALAEEARATGVEPLAIRLRPTRRAAAIRERLRAAGIAAHVVDARAVLDEGDAHDVAEANDPVRLRRVAARLRAGGFGVASLADRVIGQPEPSADAPAAAIAGNRVEVEVDNAQARTWLLAAIAEARHSLDVQVYMAADDDVGRAIEAALAAAGARGVTVRLLVDSLHGLHGSFGTVNPLLARLATRAGVELRVSGPLTKLPSMADLKQRDHRKIVIADGRVALVGGRNFAHEYYTGLAEEPLTAAAVWRQVPWLDAGARIEGPAVAAIAASFLDAWTDAGGASFPIEVPAAVGATTARVVVHRGLRDAHTLEAYLDLVDRARSHIYAVNGFPCVLELQHALLRALHRGVRVRALTGHLTPTHDGVPFAGAWSSARNTATDFVHSRLDPIVEAGGDVYLLAQRDAAGWEAALGAVSPHVHAKIMTADGERCAVGSANFDVTSAYWESELMLLVEDAAVTRGLERTLDELLASSQRIDPDDPAWREHARRRRWMRRWPGILNF